MLQEIAGGPISPTISPPAIQGTLTQALKSNRAMRTINAELVPLMIALEGPDFYDKGVAEQAAEYISDIIMAKQLGGFTSDTWPRYIHGKKVELMEFTSKVLENIGKYPFIQCLHICISDHDRDRKGCLNSSQGYARSHDKIAVPASRD